jgi:hypothetical protein
MAKKYYKAPKHFTGRTITTKTPYGTDSSMVISDEKIISQISLSDNTVLCKDDIGYYITFKDRVDSGIADPLRFDLENRQTLEIMEASNEG